MRAVPIVCFIGLLLAAGCGRHAAPVGPREATQRLSVRVQPAARRDFERRLTVQGTLVAKHTAQVAARADGNLDAVMVDVGDPVVAGETPLFQVDPVARRNAVAMSEQELAVAKAAAIVANAAVAKAEAESRKALLDFDRYDRLHKDGKVSDNEFEAAQVGRAQGVAGLEVARAQKDLADRQVARTEAALEIARKLLKDTLVVAPLSGVVSARLAEPGEQMAVGHVVLRLADPSMVEAAAFLPAQCFPDVKVGATRFRLQLQGRDAGSHPITTKAPVVDPTLRTFEVKGIVEGARDRVVPGTMADMTILFEARPGLAVPSSAILSRGGRSTVFVAQDGKAVAKPVDTGWQNDGWTEVLSGLEEGAAIVVEGQTQLVDGAAIDVL